NVRLDDPFRQAAGKLLPASAVVFRLVDPAVGPVPRAVLPRTFTCLPQRGINDVRVAGIDEHVGGAGVFVLLQHWLEGFAAVHRAEHTPLEVGSVGMSRRSYENTVGVTGIDGDLRNPLRVPQAQMLPGLAAIFRHVNAAPDP